MKLDDFLRTKNIDRAEFAAQVGVSPQAIERYANGKRIPFKAAMKRIFQVTKGKVDANEFYDLKSRRKPSANSK